ncbi:efflux transporter outer membrane subunit [Stenotrophomonas sp. S48]|uniref:efflux transporter outer membrane subunit n=1 Tax=unclassified Stenotrophomonas TaxID=196198 RepID=UPI001902475F|nr:MULTISPECIES: efflux transporter outer membrane subunit [unclassified Stenotrophomonas]MBK0028035.1 efflux transporter outer membrane subunit [Stenotrophomonas sp. S48]MBK0050325.1 efflux transporter outer membrane subunit [Stenotrophomonas sp. S49]
MRAIETGVAVSLALLLAGCSLAPTYQVPAVQVPVAYEQPTAAAAHPALAQDWWRAFNDPVLDRLQVQLRQANPNLALAVAHYDAARAAAGETASARAPQVGFSTGPMRQRQSDDKPLRSATQPAVYDSNAATFSLSFDLDLWGRLRNAAAAGHARAQASADDLAAARLSLSQQLTATYLQLRNTEAQQVILRDSIDDYQQALRLTQDRFQGEIASELDVARARHQLASAQADLDALQVHQAMLRHALAELVGAPASGFSVGAVAQAPTLPQVPADLPSALLQQRPDIAAAERRVFAANAGIGVARAAWFPQLSLTGLFGGQTSGSSALLDAGNRYWALGPLAALPVFDGGRRKAAKAEAYAEFDAASAQYRATVLAAIRQVEDQLVQLHGLADQRGHEEEAVQAARRTEQIARNRYAGGAVSYLDVVTAQTDARQAQLGLQDIQNRQLQASAALMAALGGGWSVAADARD